jgi:hypothetical protein
MRRLVIAGLLYLTGIAVILMIKPQFMFRDDGRWKEFGIGRDQDNFTYIPFWLFTVIWSVLSYVIVIFVEDALSVSSDEIELPKNNSRYRNKRQNVQRVPDATQELVPGYYMLNEGATGRNGVPRYVYLGPEEP